MDFHRYGEAVKWRNSREILRRSSGSAWRRSTEISPQCLTLAKATLLAAQAWSGVQNPAEILVTTDVGSPACLR